MPEIRLGGVENFGNINLGGIELQEIYLGGVLVWQNNQGPVYVQLYLGTVQPITVPVPFEEVTGAAASSAAADSCWCKNY